MLNDNQVDRYREDGYLVVKGLIPAEMMSAAYQRVLELMSVDYPAGWDEGDMHRMDGTAYQSEAGVQRICALYRLARAEDVFRGIVEHPRLVEAMCELLGGGASSCTQIRLARSTAT